MLEKGMYVRCPIEQMEDAREFIYGQIEEVDLFTEKVWVVFRDPFGFRQYYENIPLTKVYDYANIKRCAIHRNSYVDYRQKRYIVIFTEKKESWFYYTLMDEFEKRIFCVSMSQVMLPWRRE